MRNQIGNTINSPRTNNGLEFCSIEFNEFYRDEGISRHHIVCYTPYQNGVAERMNRTLLERVKCMVSNLGLNRIFWDEAAITTCYLVNHSSSTSIDFKTPIEVWSN